MALYDELMERGIEIDNHYSDLYFPKTREATKILKKHDCQYSIFINKFTQEPWYEVPFAYIPYWEKKVGTSAK